MPHQGTQETPLAGLLPDLDYYRHAPLTRVAERPRPPSHRLPYVLCAPRGAQMPHQGTRETPLAGWLADPDYYCSALLARVHWQSKATSRTACPSSCVHPGVPRCLTRDHENSSGKIAV